MSEKPHSIRSYGVRLLMLGCVLALGCGPQTSTDIRQVSGTVTCDGERIAEGSIVFLPVRGSKPPVAGKIKGGTFSMEVPTGSNKVQIYAIRKETVATEIPAITKAGDEVATNYLPPRYNDKTELTAEVKPDKRNEFTFPLTLK